MSTSDSGLVSTRRLESSIMFQMAHRARKTPPPDCWNLKKKIQPIKFCFFGKEKGTVYVKHHIPNQSSYTALPRNSGKPSPTLLPHMTNEVTRLPSH